MFDLGLAEFEALDTALDALVDVDPVALSDGEVHRTLMELMRQQSRLAAVTLTLRIVLGHTPHLGAEWVQVGRGSLGTRGQGAPGDRQSSAEAGHGVGLDAAHG